jgi:hypothetical protein
VETKRRRLTRCKKTQTARGMHEARNSIKMTKKNIKKQVGQMNEASDKRLEGQQMA